MNNPTIKNILGPTPYSLSPIPWYAYPAVASSQLGDYTAKRSR